MTEQLSTLILRFRDLSTAQGETISYHSNIIREKGYVWWGWWNKSGEKVPVDEFKQLNQIASTDELEIYLYDSGTLELFKARCTGIKWDSEEFSPEESREHTPSYYSDKKCRAWFKFNRIHQIKNVDDTLQVFSYVSVKSFFDDGNDRFVPFQNKRIYSARELKHQERTIWFVRPYDEDHDAKHEISIYTSSFIKPEDFPKDYITCTANELVWVSDLHFSSSDKIHAFPAERDVVGSNLSAKLLDGLSRRKTEKVAGMILSGDITWQGQREGFDMGRKFIKDFNSWASLPPDRYIICPGNHDISFTESDGPIQEAPRSATAEYSDFYRDIFNIPPNEFLCSGRRFLMDVGVSVEIASLNSLYTEQRGNSNFRGHGYVGEPQRNFVAEKMGWNKRADSHAVRIVVLHHNLLHVSYTELPDPDKIYSTVLDGEALSQWFVEHNVRLVLHGHMHDSYYAKIARPRKRHAPEAGLYEYHVVGVGSAGVANGLLGQQDRRNMFGLLQFKADHLTIEFRTLDRMLDSDKLYSLDIPY